LKKNGYRACIVFYERMFTYIASLRTLFELLQSGLEDLPGPFRPSQAEPERSMAWRDFDREGIERAALTLILDECCDFQQVIWAKTECNTIRKLLLLLGCLEKQIFRASHMLLNWLGRNRGQVTGEWNTGLCHH
jgi:hypothetical protein